MRPEFKNYVISGGKVILLLEKDIYGSDMINQAAQTVSDECNILVSDKKDNYEVILTPKENKGNLDNLAVLLNDALVSSVSLFPN